MAIYLLLLFLSIVLECFPISSSGNINLFTKILQNFGLNLDKTMLECIDYISHGAIALTVALFFFKNWSIFIKRFSKMVPIIGNLMISGFITEVLTVACWLGSSYFKEPPILLLSFGFLCTTVLLASTFFCKNNKSVTYSPYNAWVLGIAQGIALMPGISRFGSTFVVARWLGFSPSKAFQLSFLIAWPINCAAFMLGIYTVYHHHISDVLNLQVGLVMLISSCIAFFCLRFVEKIVIQNKLWFFAGYTGVLVLFALLMPF